MDGNPGKQISSRNVSYLKSVDNLRPLRPLRHAHVPDLDGLLLVARQVHFSRAQHTQELVSTLLTEIDRNNSKLPRFRDCHRVLVYPLSIIIVLSSILPDGEVRLRSPVNDVILDCVDGSGSAVERLLHSGIQLERDCVVTVNVLRVAV